MMKVTCKDAIGGLLFFAFIFVLCILAALLQG